MIDNFEQMLRNMFEPLFEVTQDPSSHPQLHVLLGQVSRVAGKGWGAQGARGHAQGLYTTPAAVRVPGTGGLSTRGSGFWAEGAGGRVLQGPSSHPQLHALLGPVRWRARG